MANTKPVELPNSGLSDELLRSLEALFSSNKENQELELLERREKRAQIEADREIRLRAKRAQMETIRKKGEEQQYFQDNCTHRLELGDTALVGQYTSDHTLLLICQNCQKSYIGRETVPAGLLPHPDRLGAVGVEG